MSDLEAALARWSLTEPHRVADTATSAVYRVRLPDGAQAALKLLKPYGSDEIDGALYMQWCDGAGAAHIIDIQGLSILMEWLDGGPLGDLVRSGRDDEATTILCDVAMQLHQPRGVAGFKPLRQQFDALFSSTPSIWPASHLPLAQRAMAIAEALFATLPPSIPLHGDLHHDNIMSSARSWLAIDPKGLLGDPAYDLANAFRNPYGADDLVRRPDRIDHLADVFAQRLGLDRRRLLHWAAAHCALSACWDHQAGNSPAGNLIMLPLLLDAVDRA